MTEESFRFRASPSAVPGTMPPTKVAAKVRAPPIRDASSTLPGRSLYIHNPTRSAMGIVQAIVNVPHELPGTTRIALGGSANSAFVAVMVEVTGPGGSRSRKPSLIVIEFLPSFQTSVAPGE